MTEDCQMVPTRAEDDLQAYRYSVMLYGATGSGKTTWAAGCAKPLFFLTEPQGAASIRQRNPEAEIIHIKTWRQFVSLWECVLTGEQVTTEDGQDALAVTWPGTSGAQSVIQTVVIDSLTDLQIVQMADVRGMDLLGSLALDRPSLTIAQWGATQDAAMGLLRQQRSLPINVVILALAQEKYESVGDDEIRRVIPLFRGKMVVPYIGQYMNAVGYLTQDSSHRRVICWKYDSRFISKKPSSAWPDLVLVREDGDGSAGHVSLGSLALKDLGSTAISVPSLDDSDYCVASREVAEED